MTILEDQGPPLTAKAAARRLGMSERFVRREAACGQLPVLRLGRSVRFRASDLDQYLDQRLSASPEVPDASHGAC